MKTRGEARREREEARCEVCGEASDDLESSGLCGRACCPSCLGMSGLCPECEETMQDEVGL